MNIDVLRQITQLSPQTGKFIEKMEKQEAEKLTEKLQKGEITTEQAIEASKDFVSEKEYNELLQPDNTIRDNFTQGSMMFIQAAQKKQKAGMVENLYGKQDVINYGLSIIGGKFSNPEIMTELSSNLIGFLENNNIKEQDIDWLTNAFSEILDNNLIYYEDKDLEAVSTVLKSLIDLSATKDGFDNSLSLMDFNQLANEFESSLTQSDYFEIWGREGDLGSNYQYAEKGNTEAETAKNILEFAQNYVNQFGNNDGNLSLEEFTNFMTRNYSGLLEEDDAKAVFEMIDMDSKGGIRADEFASYLMTLDDLDGAIDGGMNYINRLSSGIETPMYAAEKWSDYIALNEMENKHLNNMKNDMSKYHDLYFNKTTTTPETLQNIKNSFSLKDSSQEDRMAYWTDFFRQGTEPALKNLAVKNNPAILETDPNVQYDDLNK